MANKINDDVRGTRAGEDISTGNGDDVVRGLGGHDQIDGGNGKDNLSGNQGGDIINGGNGKDILVGGTGNDILTGGNGKDIFVFTNFSGSRLSGDDIITDFHNDQIDLEKYSTDFDTLAANFTDVEGNAVITTERGTITLIGVSSADLSASDFIF